MTAPTHIVTGLATVVVVGRVTGVTPDAVSLMAIVFGSLAPDIDGTGVITRPGTILRQLIGRGPANLLDAVFEFISAVVNLLFGHRGFIHSPLLAFSIFGLGGYLSKPWLEWFGIGYATHLLGDALTVGGIPIWSPFSSRRVSLSDMRTGSRQEYVFAVVMLMLTCVFGWRLLPEDVKQTHQMIYEKLAASQSQPPT
jgi:inner membrane protein